MMFSEKLIEPVSEATPAGEEGVYTQPFQELTALAEYLAARLEHAEFERMARVEFSGENADSDQRMAASNVEDSRRKLDRAEAAVKELTGRSPSLEGARDAVRDRAERMLTETGKDLRVVQPLALAWTLEQGVAGLQAGFKLADALLERYAEQLHPQPDEDDPGDVSAREMVVSEMLNGDAFVAAVRATVLLEAPGIGRFTGRDTEVIDGKLDDDGSGGARSVPHITGIAQAVAASAMGDANEILRVVSSQLDDCLQAADQLVNRFAAGAIIGDRVLKLLHRARNLLKAAMQAEAPTEDAMNAAGSSEIAPIMVQGGVQRAGAGASAGALRSRDDARRLILQVSKFLEETEPSHPAPFFLRRAERLLGAKDFFAIIADMAPDAIGEMQRITGHRESE